MGLLYTHNNTNKVNGYLNPEKPMNLPFNRKFQYVNKSQDTLKS